MNRRQMIQTLGLSAVTAAGWAALGDPELSEADEAPGGGLAGAGPASPPGEHVLFAGGEYKLPPLPYAYDALEPYLDKQTMMLHHDKHHAGYVRGLNATLARLAEARDKGELAAIKALCRDAAFHGSGHFLHALFWTNMKPGGGGEPKGELAKAIAADFGGFQKFREQLSAASSAVEGSGWGVLAFEPISGALRVLEAEKHQNLTQWGVVPVLVIDVWEHAYYLKYQNRRDQFIKAFFEVVNWDDVQARLARAREATRAAP